MKLLYLGTGAAEGGPAAFCHCPVCETARARGGREIRTRSQVLIDGTLSVDFPPDAYWHSLRFGVDLSAISHLLVTHSHMDHFYAHDFVLRGYKYAHSMTSGTLSIYGNAEVGKVLLECTRREMREEVRQGISFAELSAYRTQEIGAYAVTPLPARHSKAEEAFVYLIECGEKRVLYLNDTGLLYDEVYEHLHGLRVDLVSFDCTFAHRTAGEEARHMGIEDNMRVKRELECVGAVRSDTRYVITHFSHNEAPLAENLAKIERDYGVVAAYDGMEIEI